MKNVKTISVVYDTMLYLRGQGVVDRVKRNDEVLALVAFADLSKEAYDDDFGKGQYVVSLLENWFDEKGRLIYAKSLKYLEIERN